MWAKACTVPVRLRLDVQAQDPMTEQATPRPCFRREERMSEKYSRLRGFLQDRPAREGLTEAYRHVRRFTLSLCEPLETEDYVVQTMPDVSPTRWHLAHTNWFFETFVLREAFPGYREFHPQYNYLFNSYYNTIGSQFQRPDRGLLTRPTVAEIMEYRAAVDRRMEDLFAHPDEGIFGRFLFVVQVGLHHEQQHQELMLTDIKHVLAFNPLRPAYREPGPDRRTAGPAPAGDSPEGGSVLQLYGDVWEWTRSPYTPFPGFRPNDGALGEYNGKFMCGQQVLRGGSAATSVTHARPTYRNFFYPQQRWQFVGFRLAKDADRS